MAGYAPINVAGMRDGKLAVHDNQLHELLRREDVKGRPLVIVSIAGKHRTGKSFMMNILIRYLMRKGWENPKWFGEKEAIVYGGTSHGRKLLRKPNFEWRSGVEACTAGINICPEVFHVPLKDKRMAAVLLVDTQGLFDDDSSPDTNAKIMSLSLLLSSHLILNIKSDIDTRHYDHIQLCISVAKSIAKITSDEEATAFQKLTLLVRDFEHNYPFGDSRDGYLRQKLNKPSKSAEVEEQKKAVKSAFDSLGCFLLPHPGKGVTNPGIGGVSNKDMDKEFRQFAKQFVESVFDLEKLTVKAIDENVVDSVELLNVLGRVGKAFRDGEAPTSETLQKSAVTGNNTKALNEAVSEYRQKMNNLRDESYKENLESIVQKSKQNALALYDTETKNVKERDTVKIYKLWLKVRLEVLGDKAIRINSEKKTLLDQKYEATGKMHGEGFERSLEQTMAQAYIKASCFDSWVDNYLLNEVIPVIKDEPDWAQQKIRRAFTDKIRIIKEENKRNEKFRSVDLDDIPKPDKQKSRLTGFGQCVGLFIRGVTMGIVQR